MEPSVLAAPSVVRAMERAASAVVSRVGDRAVFSVPDRVCSRLTAAASSRPERVGASPVRFRRASHADSLLCATAGQRAADGRPSAPSSPRRTAFAATPLLLPLHERVAVPRPFVFAQRHMLTRCCPSRRAGVRPMDGHPCVSAPLLPGAQTRRPPAGRRLSLDCARGLREVDPVHPCQPSPSRPRSIRRTTVSSHAPDRFCCRCTKGKGAAMRLRGGSGSETSTPSTPQRLIEGIMDAAAPPTPTLFKRLASEYDSRCILKEAAVFFSKMVGDTVRSAPASSQASQGFIRLVAERLNSMDDVELTTNMAVLEARTALCAALAAGLALR